MRIVFYISSMSPAGGIERVLSQHIHFLATENEVIVITDDDKPSFYELPINVKCISLNIDTHLTLKDSTIKRIFKIGYTLIKNIKRLNIKFKELNPDCVYTVHPLNLLKVVLSIKNYKKIFVTEHASINGYNFIYRKIALFLYRRIKLLTVPTTLDSNIYNSFGVKNEYLPNPLPFYPEVSSSLKNKIAINIGRFTDDKQHVLLLELWAKSNAIKRGWVLKIIGKGENEHKVISKIEELNIKDSIIIEPPKKDITKEYLNASLFLLASRAEGFGLVLAEAMACGVPCISFNCPSGPRDIINNEEDGYLVDVGNNTEYINRIDLLVDNFEIRNKLGTNAKFAIKKFSSKMINERLNELVNSNFKKIIE